MQWEKSTLSLQPLLDPSFLLQTWLDILCANVRLPVHDHLLCRVVNFDTRVCRKCTTHETGDEAHVLLRCPSTHCIRESFASTLTWYTDFKFMVRQNVKPAFAQFAVAAVQHYLLAP